MYNDDIVAKLPKQLAVEHTYEGLLITRRWFGFKVIALTAFALFWNGMLSFVLFDFYNSGMFDGMPWFVRLFPLLHVAVGLFVIYRVIAGYLNKTRILVDYEKITVRHGPVPYWGNKTVSTFDVEQLYSKQVVVRSSKSRSVTYQVRVQTRDGKTIRLVRNLDSMEQAKCIEKAIETQLDIKDRPVEGNTDC